LTINTLKNTNGILCPLSTQNTIFFTCLRHNFKHRNLLSYRVLVLLSPHVIMAAMLDRLGTRFQLCLPTNSCHIGEFSASKLISLRKRSYSCCFTSIIFNVKEIFFRVAADSAGTTRPKIMTCFVVSVIFGLYC